MNNELKEEFISKYYGATESFVRFIFASVESLEESLSKDLADFLKEEIIDMLRGFGSGSVESLRVKTSILRQYTNYYMSKNMSRDGINHYDEITTVELDECVNKVVKNNKYISREELLDLLKDFANPCDSYFMLAIYEGIGAYGEKMSELMLTSKSGIKEHSIELYGGRIIEVSDELIKLAIESSEMEVYDNLIENINHKTTMALAPYGLILNPRTTCRNPMNVTSAYSRCTMKFMRLKEYLGISHMSMPRLQLSGCGYELRKILEKNNTTYKEVFHTDEFQSVLKKYGYDNMQIGRFHQTIKDYLE